MSNLKISFKLYNTYLIWKFPNFFCLEGVMFKFFLSFFFYLIDLLEVNWIIF